MTKTMIIMRGLPGSGKTTQARATYHNGLIFSTDDYFIGENGYVFNPEQVTTAHVWNQGRVEGAMTAEHPLIVVDNTNTRLWEMMPYFRLASFRNYRVVVEEPTTPWRMDPAECFKRCEHGVPLEKIIEMRNRWEGYDYG